MSCISTNRIGDNVHVDCLVKRITGCRASLHIPRVFPAIACSVAIPNVANAESVKSRMKMTCCSKYRQLLDRPRRSSASSIRLPPVRCWREEHLYQMTVWPCGRLPRIRYRSRRFDMSGPDLGLGTKKRRLQAAQKSHLEVRSGFRLCQRWSAAHRQSARSPPAIC